MFLNCDTAVLIRFLERLGLASRSRGGLEMFFGTSRLVSVLRVQRLGLVSVLWLNVLCTSLSLPYAKYWNCAYSEFFRFGFVLWLELVLELGVIMQIRSATALWRNNNIRLLTIQWLQCHCLLVQPAVHLWNYSSMVDATSPHTDPCINTRGPCLQSHSAQWIKFQAMSAVIWCTCLPLLQTERCGRAACWSGCDKSKTQ